MSTGQTKPVKVLKNNESLGMKTGLEIDSNRNEYSYMTYPFRTVTLFSMAVTLCPRVATLYPRVFTLGPRVVTLFSRAVALCPRVVTLFRGIAL